MFRFKKDNSELVEIPEPICMFEPMYVNCECTSADHVFRFSYFLNDDGNYIDEDLYLECILSYDGFWSRFKTAFLYLINAKNINRWNTIIVSRKDAENIKRLCELYLHSNEEIKNIVTHQE